MAKRRYSRKSYKKNKSRRIVFLFLKIGLLTASVFIISGLFVFLYYAKDLPRPEKFTERRLAEPTKIYDREGKVLLYEIYGEEKRTVISLEEVPEHLKGAILAAEDSSFYSHFGLDIKGIIRAALANLKLKEPAQGASTISQQLIRSSFLTLEKTAQRKIREIILTLELERKYSKDQIFEFYLNQIPFGSNAYGIEEASQTYFKKPVKDVSLTEGALLAALIQAPSYLSPYGSHKKELLARKDYIINRMNLSQEEKDAAQEEDLEFSKVRQKILAPHFIMRLKLELEQKYGEKFLKESGLKVMTTLDWELQELAERVVKEGAKINEGEVWH